jgi:hypothetical protein
MRGRAARERGGETQKREGEERQGLWGERSQPEGEMRESER